MRPGELVENRFQLLDVAGSGGMGTVYRALDRSTGVDVAFKVLRSASQDASERFAREVRVLSGLRHPGIVRYIADGRTHDGEMWLAMEWLEGESLSQRIARGALSPAEAVELVRRIAEALGAAHERGVIHRDLKPSNLFVVGGDLERVKVLDFGVARVSDASATRTGVMIGTPGYMAPEQARGERNVGARSDVFALGCLLFECLTGKAPFVGDNVMAVLAKILLEDAPRVGVVRPEVPEALDDLVARTLSKNPDDRPRDGAQLAAELAALGTVSSAERHVSGTHLAALTTTERRLLCVVLIDVGAKEAEDVDSTKASVPSFSEPTLASTPGSQPYDDTIAEPAGSQGPELKALREAAEAHGARLQRLVDGSLVVTLMGTGGTADQAMQAARCALALKQHVPEVPMALATGRGVMAGRWPVGEAIDRAASLIAGARKASRHLVRIDDVTAGLLDTRFDVGGDEAGLYLLGERDLVQATRTLLGKPTPCVGRDRELGVLSGLYEEAIGEPMARAVIVTGAAGVGKSRVRYELLRRIQGRDEPVEIWIGRGDPLRTGSPFGMIAPALRHAAGILDGEPSEVRRQKLRARVMRNATAEVTRTTMFLGELVGVSFSDEDSMELKAARADALLMADQVRLAFEHFLALETAAQPVVIVLEDLHWGDLPTVKLIDSALRALPDRPWFVVAIARPDVHELFPRLWSERNVQELRLDELTKKGSEKLVRQVLGAQASDALVARLVEQAGGNAFYLEELIRAVAEGKGDVMPETVLAVVQGRLERLEVDARRVLRAASVFGQRFWRSGVTKLLGGEARDSTVRAWLDELAERELVAKAPVSRFPDEDEYQFRHSMVREAAYAMLTESDRKLGHRLAGEWLQYSGEMEAMVLAEHFERGGELSRAAAWYRPAVEQALAAGDFKAATVRAQRGVACGATGETLGLLRRAQAEAHKWCGEFVEAERCALEAMTLLLVGSASWFSAAGEAAEASGKLGDIEQLAATAAALDSAPDLEGELAARVTATATCAFQLFNHGRYQLAVQLLDRIESFASEVRDPRVLARIYQTRSSRAMFAGDAGAYVVTEVAAALAFEQAGDLRYACMQHGHVGYAYLEIGAYADAERWLRQALEGGQRMGLQNVVATAKHNLGRALQHQDRLDEAVAIEAEAVEAFAAQGDRRLEAASRNYLANIHAMRGELATAEDLTRRGLQTVQAASRPGLLADLASILLRQGRAPEALIAAREGHELFESLGGVEEGESQIRLQLAEALHATGDSAGARAAIRTARDRLLGRAAKITDPSWRASFLENLPENARTLGLATQLLDG